MFSEWYVATRMDNASPHPSVVQSEAKITYMVMTHDATSFVVLLISLR